jgi:hypothetical protein
LLFLLCFFFAFLPFASLTPYTLRFTLYALHLVLQLVETFNSCSHSTHVALPQSFSWTLFCRYLPYPIRSLNLSFFYFRGLSASFFRPLGVCRLQRRHSHWHSHYDRDDSSSVLSVQTTYDIGHGTQVFLAFTFTLLALYSTDYFLFHPFSTFILLTLPFHHFYRFGLFG